MTMLERTEARPCNDKEKVDTVLTVLCHSARLDLGDDANIVLYEQVHEQKKLFKPQFLTK